jgi:hypothetical protein
MGWLCRCRHLIPLVDLYITNPRDPQAALALIDHLHERRADQFLGHQRDQRPAQDIVGHLTSFLNVCHQGRCLVSFP